MKRFLLTITALVPVFGVSSVTAATIANWQEVNAGSTNSGMNTDSPTIGDGSANDADNAFVGGQFGTVGSPESVTLAIGETLTVSGSVVLTGGAAASNPDQFRIAVGDDGGQLALGSLAGWNSGWMFEPTDDIFQGRTDDVIISAFGNAVALGATVTDTGGAWSANSTVAYDFSFSITRDSATTVDLFSSVTGGDNAVNLTGTVDNVTTSAFTYTAVAFLFGNNMDLDQGSFSNVQYSVIPEPSALVLGALGSLLILRRKR